MSEARAAVLARAGQVHGHATISVRMGLVVTTGDHGRVPRDWGSLTEE